MTAQMFAVVADGSATSDHLATAACFGSPQLVACAIRLYAEQNAYGIATPDTLLGAFRPLIPSTEQTLSAYGVHF